MSGVRLLVGISPDGCRLPRASRPVHVFFVLLGGEDLPADDYLQYLSVATTLIQTDEAVEELLSCRDPEEVCDVLTARLQRHPSHTSPQIV